MDIISNQHGSNNPGNANGDLQTTNQTTVHSHAPSEGRPQDENAAGHLAPDNHDGAVDPCELPEIPETAKVQQIVDSLRRSPLHENHLADLRASGLNDETIHAAGLCSASAAATRLLGFHDSPALVIPYLNHQGYVRIRPDQPRIDAKGRSIKYETPRGGVNHLYIPGRTGQRLIGMGSPVDTIIVTEGEKKALKADQEDFPTISVPGVAGWRSRLGALPELNKIGWRGHTAVIAFDSDVTRKPDVKEAITALYDHLKQQGAEVKVLLLPDIEGHDKTGLDDFLVTKGSDTLRTQLGAAKDWFGTLLDMLPRGLTPDALEAAVQPIYRLIQKSGPLGLANLARQLWQRLGELGYEKPAMAELKQAIRKAPPYKPEWAQAQENGTDAENGPTIRFIAEGPDGNFPDQPERQGLYDCQAEKPQQLCNFSLLIDEDVRVEDDLAPHRRFKGRLVLLGEEKPFVLDAKDFGNNGKLTAAIYEIAGPKAEWYCTPERLRTAVSAVSDPEPRRASTNIGWTTERDAYLVQGGKVTAAGFQAANANDLEIDLSAAEYARRLNLRPLECEQLATVKRHVIEDLLCLCPDQRVGYALLAAVALSVLYRFTDGMNRPLLWIQGLSGNGKSFLAKLFQNFFGDFPVAAENSTISWLSTAKRIQLEGYYFRDALFLVDDYKPEHTRATEATSLLQAYADSAARSRLNRDATAATSREIRGLLVCTGEDVPDHSASASARTIVVPYPTGDKDLERGKRCQQQRRNYSAVTTDFIRHCLATGRPLTFTERVAALYQQFYQQIRGRDNDIRIAGNFALLGAAFEEIADYFADVWPEAQGAKRLFIDQHIPSLWEATLHDVQDQKASRVFLAMLANAIQQNAVRIKDHPTWGNLGAPLIGRLVLDTPAEPTAGPTAVTASPTGRIGPSQNNKDLVLVIWTTAALMVVQKALQQMGRPPLQVTPPTLLQQLREDGVLLGLNNQPLTAKSDPTRQLAIERENRRAFRIRQAVLMEGLQ